MPEDLLSEYTRGEGSTEGATVGEELVEIEGEDEAGAEYTRRHPLNPFGVYGEWTALNFEGTTHATPNASTVGTVTHNFQAFKPIQLVATKTGTFGFINSANAGNVPIWGNTANADLAGFPATSEMQPNFSGEEIAAGQSISFNYGSSITAETVRLTIYGYAKKAKPVVAPRRVKRVAVRRR